MKITVSSSAGFCGRIICACVCAFVPVRALVCVCVCVFEEGRCSENAGDGVCVGISGEVSAGCSSSVLLAAVSAVRRPSLILTPAFFAFFSRWACRRRPSLSRRLLRHHITREPTALRPFWGAWRGGGGLHGVSSPLYGSIPCLDHRGVVMRERRRPRRLPLDDASLSRARGMHAIRPPLICRRR